MTKIKALDLRKLYNFIVEPFLIRIIFFNKNYV
jgi:hypothetical protein